MIDTHSHVNFKDFKDDYDEVMKRALKNNVSMINVGSQFSTSRRAVKLSEQYENSYAAIGIHPFHLAEREIEERVDKNETIKIKSKPEKFNYHEYRELAKSSKKVVAIGECGIDYHYIDQSEIKKERKIQVKAFNEQIDLANELKLPMIIHSRNAYAEIKDILDNNPIQAGAVVHSFVGTWQEAEMFLQMGFYLGFNGIITFKNKVEHIQEVVKKAPADLILSETDCPYLTPEPYRGKRNESIYVEYVIKKIAQLRNCSFEKADQITTQNAKKLFNL